MTDEQISDEYRIENDTCIITCRASSPVDFVISGEDPFTTATALPCGDISAPRGNLSTSAALGRSAPDEYDDPFLAGFRDCRCQILGYMQQMQQQSDTAATISNHSTRASASCDDVIDYTALINDELVGCLRQHLLDAEHRLRDVASSRHQTSSTPVTWKHSASSTSEKEVEEEAVTGGLDEMSLHIEYSLDDSALGASFEASSLTAVDQDVIDNTGSVTDTVNVPPEVELSHNANELMRLACNNPDVGRLLDELFELMDYDDDDYDVIGSDVESDDGVHEMNNEIDSYVDATHSSQHTASGATDVLTT